MQVVDFYVEKSEEKEFEKPPVGLHLGILIKIIDLGTQLVEFEGKKKTQPKIALVWELPEELMSDGRPFIISKKFTLSTGERASLTAILTSWLGKAPDKSFNLSSLLGKGCNVSVSHDKSSDGLKTYANVKAITALMKSQNVPAPQNELVVFSLKAFNQQTFDGLSDYYKKTIALSPEYQSLKGVDYTATSVKDELDDEVPF